MLILAILRFRRRRWMRLVSCFLVGLISYCWLTVFQVSPTPAQTSPHPVNGGHCAAITQPLTPEERSYAQSAWNYFVDNVQPATGLSNSAGGYPSGTLWDLGNYLTAMNAARWLGFIDQAEFDSRLNQFLTSLGQVPLFEDTLPNKVYNSATGDMVDYNNTPLERGLGWSALDIGRILAAFHIIRTCHPQYADWLQGVVDSWQVGASVDDGTLYGATVLADDTTLKVQEGRLGYEEYAARGYALWGFDTSQALSYEPFEFVDIYGLQIPVDRRDYQTTNANNYVVSESYILDAIEFGLADEQADYARRVFEAQKRRYEATGLLTAVSEDNINQAPYFLYSTVYANGEPWAVITETNELHPDLRTLSTKSAFGWRYIYPDDRYAQQIFDHVKQATNSNRGYYAGIYESGLYDAQPPLNDILTGNTNGLIMEVLYYKARGYQPMLTSHAPPEATTTPLPATANTSQNVSSATSSAAPATTGDHQPSLTVASIAPVGPPQPSACPLLDTALSLTDSRYAKTAWQYFEANYQTTGLVRDRSDLDGTTLWGTGDYLSALHAARILNIIDANTFDERVRHLLGALQQMALFSGELPHRAYSTTTLDPIDYGGNATPEGNGWSGLDVGRLLAAFHTLKTCHPEYTDVVDQIALDWSYLRVIRQGRIANAQLAQDDRGRDRIRVKSAAFLGYEEYAARAFQLWGFDAEQSAVGGNYLTTEVEGQAVPVQRSQPNQRRRHEVLNTTSTPFILYGLEFGFDPQISTLVQAIFEAEANRYNRTGLYSASGTTLMRSAPYVLHSTVASDGQPWAAVDDTGMVMPTSRVVSTAVAFAYYTLFPQSRYGRDLWLATLDLYNPSLGYYEGFYEDNGRTAVGFTSSTNSLILQALLHKNTTRQPLIQPHSSLDSPWWQAIRTGDPLGLGLPATAAPAIAMVSTNDGAYWAAHNESSSTVHLPPGPRAPVPQTREPSVASDGRSDSQRSPASPLQVAQPRPPESSQTTVSSPPDSPNPVGDTPLPATPAEARVAQSLQFPLTHVNQLPHPDNQAAAQRAWAYFDNNWNARTGMVNAVDRLAWGTWWDQGSMMLGLHAGYQLGLLPQAAFHRRLSQLLETLATMPLPTTGLPNKSYSTATGDMRTLGNRPDPNGTSGWSVLDLARYLIALHTLKTHYPIYGDQIDGIVARYDLTKLVNQGWLWGSGAGRNGLQYWQEGRLGYEQYAAYGLALWGIEADNALHHPPTRTMMVDGVPLLVDQRDRASSGASNYLTNDPYLLWGLELGWPDTVVPQVQNLLQVQANRYANTGILTAVNEDSLDRQPYFLYYTVYADGQPWSALTTRGNSHPELRFLSTKAAFAWQSLFPDDPYCQTLRHAVQNLADIHRGYLSGRYEDSELGPNRAININTNAIILESLLYQAQGGYPLARPA